MSDLIHKSHNVYALLYHTLCPTKYRRAVITDEVEVLLRRVCLDIGNHYKITFTRSRSWRSAPTVTMSIS